MEVNVYEVTTDLGKIDFGATGVAEILQNVAFILATPQFSCPLARDFAWSPDVDAPMQVAQAKAAAKITEAIRLYEPRAEVTRIEFRGDALNGQLIPIVKVRIADGAV